MKNTRTISILRGRRSRVRALVAATLLVVSSLLTATAGMAHADLTGPPPPPPPTSK